jgi:8-oxo-dGTP diphosphatase
VPFTYDYPRPAVSADCALFAMRAEDLAILLIKRKNAPFKGAWALPGGFVNENEALDRAAARELMEETGITGVPLEQLGAFGDPGRDPRAHVVTVAFYSFVVADTQPVAADDAAEAAWHSLRSLPLPSWGARPPAKTPLALAFDHAKIIDAAWRRLQERLDAPTRESPFSIIPARFTLTELQRVYEAVLGRTIDQRTFRARMLAKGLVEPVSRAQATGGARVARGGRGAGAQAGAGRGQAPRGAQLYRFKVARRA